MAAKSEEKGEDAAFSAFLSEVRHNYNSINPF